MRPSILIAGVGNIFLGDDAFGVEVVRALAKRPLPAGVSVVDYGIRGFDLAYALLDPWDVVVIVDALPRGGAPGTGARNHSPFRRPLSHTRSTQPTLLCRRHPLIDPSSFSWAIKPFRRGTRPLQVQIMRALEAHAGVANYRQAGVATPMLRRD